MVSCVAEGVLVVEGEVDRVPADVAGEVVGSDLAGELESLAFVRGLALTVADASHANLRVFSLSVVAFRLSVTPRLELPVPRFNPAPGWPAAPEGWTPPPGWQPDPSWPAAPVGWQVMVEDAPAYGSVAPQSLDGALLEFTSHIAGKNAKVRVYRDRVEWERVGLNNIARHSMAAVTVGLSYAATGVTRKRDTEVIPMRSISSVTTKKGVLNTLVKVFSSGNVLEMNVSHKEAQQVRDLINGIISGGDAAPVASSATAPQDGPDLAQLADLHRQGILTDEEFTAAKKKALGI